MGVYDRLADFEYRGRNADGELGQLLRAAGAVVIEGPRGSGKTATARRAAASEVRLDVDDDARAAGLIEPGVLLEGLLPRLIDEWQLVPALWNRVRAAIDDRGGRAGQFILTGSAVPADDITRHTGALRILRLRMRPMTLAESGHGSGRVSLRSIMAGEPVEAPDPGLTIDGLADRIVVGGWPALQGRTHVDAATVLRAYLDETSRIDLHRVDGVRRDPANVARVIRSLARHVGSAASARSIAADVGGADGPIDHHTVADYIRALERVFVVEDLPAWAPALRSRRRLREAPVRHFVDPSLAAAALGADPMRLLRDVRTFGFLFESLVVRDLRVHAQSMDARVYHYRDSRELEADAIVETSDGRWAAFEVKLGHSDVDRAAASLRKVAERVDPDRHGAPAALVVVTGWGYGYRRPDGVSVVPIGALAA